LTWALISAAAGVVVVDAEVCAGVDVDRLGAVAVVGGLQAAVEAAARLVVGVLLAVVAAVVAAVVVVVA